MDVGLPGEGEATLRESIALLRQIDYKSFLALALKDLGAIIATYEGRFFEGREMMEESALLYSENEDHRMLSWSLSVLGSIKLSLGDYEGGRINALQGLTLARKKGEKIMIGFSNAVLGNAAMLENKLDDAKRFLLDALPYRENLFRDQVDLLNTLGVVYTLSNDHAQAQGYFLDALRTALERYGSFPMYLQFVIPGLALFLLKNDQIERAIEIFSMARSHFPYVAKAKYIHDLIGKRIYAAANCLKPKTINFAEQCGQTLDPWETAKELLTELQEQASE
jgi:tetratricopeptide (TPR) repeat protein